MNLQHWLKRKCMKVETFAKMVGCTRQVIYKVKKGQTISPKFADRINEITNGSVFLSVRRVGRPRQNNEN